MRRSQNYRISARNGQSDFRQRHPGSADDVKAGSAHLNALLTEMALAPLRCQVIWEGARSNENLQRS